MVKLNLPKRFPPQYKTVEDVHWQEIKLPAKLQDIVQSPSRYNVMYGGRNSAKTMTTCIIVLLECLKAPVRVLCVRSVLLSISQSVHQSLKMCINMFGLQDQFIVLANKITSANGSEIVYSGLSNTSKIKSYADFDICYVEEADQVTKDQWDILIPTLRKDTVKFYIVFNPCLEEDETYQRFVIRDHYKARSKVVCINYMDNPFCPKTSVEEAEAMREYDLDGYNHIYMGHTKKQSNDVVFRRVVKQRCNPDPDMGWDGPYYGMDHCHGGADAAALIEVWMSPNRELYVRKEAYKPYMTMDKLEDFALGFQADLGEYMVRADGSVPLLNQHLRERKFNVVNVKKTPGSVEEGYAYLKAISRIIVDPACPEAYAEFTGARYKKNKAGDPLPEIKDGADHAIAATRYAIQPLIAAFKGKQSRDAAAQSSQYGLNNVG